MSGDNSHLSYIQSDGDPQISDEVKPDLTIGAPERLTGHIFESWQTVTPTLRKWVFETLYKNRYLYRFASTVPFAGQWRVWQRLALTRLRGVDVLELGCGLGDLLADMLEPGIIIVRLSTRQMEPLHVIPCRRNVWSKYNGHSGFRPTPAL